VDDLTSTDTDKALSANQGKVLQDGKEPADATILKEADIVDNLTSTDTDKPLSANQGKVLQDGKEPADATILKEADIVDNLTSTSTTAPLSANQGKVLQDGKLNLSGGTMTGDLTIPDKIIHSGDTNTAIRFPSADTVTVETGGSERMRVDSSGDVGIGTTSPATKLDVNGSLNATDVLSFGPSSAKTIKQHHLVGTIAASGSATTTILPQQTNKNAIIDIYVTANLGTGSVDPTFVKANAIFSWTVAELNRYGIGDIIKKTTRGQNDYLDSTVFSVSLDESATNEPQIVVTNNNASTSLTNVTIFLEIRLSERTS
jgi:hypothetical protein